MTFTVHPAEQRSPEWFAARCGRLTGSRAGDMLATVRTGEAAARRDYRFQLVCERLTGQPQENGYVNAEMQRGIDKEPDAFAAYEAHTGHVVQRSGFLAHTSLLAGCSLDGHLDDFTGILELKVPKSATHCRYLRSGLVPSEHLPQIRHNLWISGASFCDFASWDDRFPSELQLFLVRVEAKDADLGGYEKAAREFLTEVDAEHQGMLTLMKRRAVA